MPPIAGLLNKFLKRPHSIENTSVMARVTRTLRAQAEIAVAEVQAILLIHLSD